jgi:hypothetical protein
MQFITIHWDNETQVPYLYLRDSKLAKDTKIKLETDQDFYCEIKPGKFCIGSYEPPYFNLIACPNNSECEKGVQCYECRAKNSTQFLSLNALSFEQIEILKTLPHLNYINLFPNGYVKTGVSSISRKFTRILEQGALATMYFASADGYISRRIENFVSSALQIRQAITSPEKLRGFLIEIPNQTSCEQKLKLIYKDIQDCIADEFKKNILNDYELYFNWEKYNIKFEIPVSSFRYINYIQPGMILSGKIKGIYGEIIFLETIDKELIALNAKNLQGFKVNIGNTLAPLVLNNIEPELIKRTEKPAATISMF